YSDPEPEPSSPAQSTPAQPPPPAERKRPAPLPPPAELDRAVKREKAKADSLQLIRAYAQNIAVGKPAVAAAYPFTLMINGRLSDIEHAKLLDMISSHQMGFTDVDLEPQLEAGRVLLPRISEYAGILIIQALRDANVTFQFGSSDSIYATEDTASQGD